MKSNYSILTNFFINDKETLQRMKDSLDSFKSANSQKWIVNIRGKYKDQTRSYIENLLGSKCKITHYDFKDWQKETKIIINEINSDYILYWVEDHILQVDSKILDEVVNEMKITHSDYLSYTFYCFGYHKNIYDNLKLNCLYKRKHIKQQIYNHTKL